MPYICLFSRPKFCQNLVNWLCFLIRYYSNSWIFLSLKNPAKWYFLPIIYFANIYDINCVHTLLHCIQIPASLISSRRPDIDLYKAWGLEETSFSQSFSFSSSRSASADRFNRASSWSTSLSAFGSESLVSESLSIYKLEHNFIVHLI